LFHGVSFWFAPVYFGFSLTIERYEERARPQLLLGCSQQSISFILKVHNEQFAVG